MNDMHICTECGKVGSLDEFYYHQTAKAYDHGEGDWEPGDGYYTCCKPHETLVDAVECKECGEHYGIGFKHTCPIAEADTRPNADAIIRVVLDQLAEIVEQIEAVNETLRRAQ